MSIVGVLLAAGAASRFGGGKLLAAIDGVAMCVRAADNLRAAADQVVAVVRPDDKEVHRQLALTGVQVVVCERASEGMGASLVCAIQHSRNAQGWIVALADMPFVQPATIQAIAAALRSGAGIAAPYLNGERGHPVGFAGALRNELLQCRGDAGAREVLRSHASFIEKINADDRGVLIDIDTREQLDQHPARRV